MSNMPELHVRVLNQLPVPVLFVLNPEPFLKTNVAERHHFYAAPAPTPGTRYCSGESFFFSLTVPVRYAKLKF
jgi:hypothetical protein